MVNDGYVCRIREWQNEQEDSCQRGPAGEDRGTSLQSHLLLKMCPKFWCFAKGRECNSQGNKAFLTIVKNTTERTHGAFKRPTSGDLSTWTTFLCVRLSIIWDDHETSKQDVAWSLDLVDYSPGSGNWEKTFWAQTCHLVSINGTIFDSMRLPSFFVWTPENEECASVTIHCASMTQGSPKDEKLRWVYQKYLQ